LNAPDDSVDTFDLETVFRTFFDRSGVRVAVLDHKLCVLDASVDFAGEFEQAVADLRGQGLPELVHPSVRTQVTQQLTRLFEGQRARVVERFLAARPGGAVIGGELTGLAVHGAAGLVESILVVLRPEAIERGAVVVGSKGLFSEMEARILEGVAAGASTVQLAALLYLSCGGVEYHLTALLRSMKVGNRSALVSKAYSMGLFGVGAWPPRVLPDYVA
jgi:DNA-binding CsgD family transcriptional regulator